MGQKRTFGDTLSNVCFRGQSGHPSNVVFLFFYIAGFVPSPSALDPAFLRRADILRI
jgi:hypothetical protein